MARSSRTLLFLLGLALSLPRPAAAQDDTPPETRAAWVLDSRFASREGTEATIKRLADAGFNLALVRVWFQGATLYPSDVVPAAGGPRQHTGFAGRDPLKEAIETGRRYGVRIGAWMEYGLAERLSGTAPGPILTAHPEWRMIHRDGVTDYSGPASNRQYWMDPALPAVRAFVRDLFTEVATKYPDLAVVEYDRFRYPSPDFSYSPAAVSRFMAETGQGDPRAQPSLSAPYVAWREQQVTRLAGEVYRSVKRANPAVVVGAAVVPTYMFAGSEDKMQDWPTWADSGYVDVLEPMLYGNSVASFGSLLANARAALRTKVPLYPGFSVEDGVPASAQVREARRQGAPGVTLWYEGALSDTAAANLRAGPFAQRVNPHFDEYRLDDGDPGFRISGPWSVQATGFAGDSRLIAAGAQGSARWSLKPLRAGTYQVHVRWVPGADRAPAALYSAIITSPSQPDSPTVMFGVDQRTGGGWTPFRASVSGFRERQDSLHIMVSARAEGAVSADAVRIVRVQPYRVEEVLAADPLRVQLRLTYAPTIALLTPSRFQIPGATVTTVEWDQTDARLLTLRLGAPLSEGVDYALSASGIPSEQGYTIEPAPVSFRFTPSAIRTLDDAETGFSITGTWAPISTGTGGGARTAPQGPVLATWFTRTETAGRYAVEAFVPDVAGRSAQFAYLIGHRAGFDTVRVATGTSGWIRLGTYEFDANGSALVRLLGAQSAPGTLVADAVRWSRTLTTTAAAAAPEAPAPTLRAFPNPAREAVRLRLDAAPNARLEVELFDVLGRRLHAFTHIGPLDAPLDLSALGAGLYVVRVTVGDGARARVVSTPIIRRP